MNDLLSSLDSIGQPPILVVGDAMLDCYTCGTAERVSPEAPVLILRAEEREVRPGGAASVAMLLCGLEAKVTLASVLGDDPEGHTVRKLLDEVGINARPTLTDQDRPTTTKERFLGRADHRQPHQILRVDNESRNPISADLETQLCSLLTELIPQQAAVLISDYGKGVCTERVVNHVINECRKADVPVLVDPARAADFHIYRGATVLKPNRREAELAVGHPIQSPLQAVEAAIELRERYQFEAVVITLDRDGLVFATDGEQAHLPIAAQSVCDITGAGDTVLATLGLGFAAKLPIASCCQLANIAAGLQVSQLGVIPILRTRLLQELRGTNPEVRESSPIPSPCVFVPERRGSSFSPKLITLEEAKNLATQYRNEEKVTVVTNGCFDLLHVGHVTMLEEAATLGDILIVAINSDENVRRLKGTDRPVMPQQDRTRMLASLECVDHVLIFDDPTPHRLLETIRPDVLVKGGTTTDIVGREVVEAYGGQIIRTVEVKGLSTTALLAAIHSSRSTPSLQEVHRCD